LPNRYVLFIWDAAHWKAFDLNKHRPIRTRGAQVEIHKALFIPSPRLIFDMPTVAPQCFRNIIMTGIVL